MKRFIRSWLGIDQKPRRKRSAFAGAKSENVLASWIFRACDVNEILSGEHETLRTRSRDLARNNFLVKGFGNQADIQALGPKGIRLQNKGIRANGEVAEVSNRIIEENWKSWGMVCDVTRCGNLRTLDGQILRCLWRDGEAFIRRFKNWEGNKFKYGIKVIDPALIDDNLTTASSASGIRLESGHMIRMGVELDPEGVPVAYFLKRSSAQRAGILHTRIPAREMIHAFIQDEPGQTRGVPWIAAAMTQLKHLDGFMEAAVVNARASALQMGFLESSGDDEADLDEGDEFSDDGAVWNMEAGIIRQLPAGRKFTSTNFGFPDAAMESFVKSIMKAITSSLPGSYASVSGDIENASWSALRNDEMRAKSSWDCVKWFYIENIRKPIYEDWLTSSLMANIIRIDGREPVIFTMSDFDRMNRPMWFPPVYPSADELKRQNANKTRIELGTASREMIIGEEGNDMSDVDASRRASQSSEEGIAPAVTEKPVIVNDNPDND